MMDFGLITLAAAVGIRTGAGSVELSQQRHYGTKMQLWAVCRVRRTVIWTTWLYYGGK